MSDITVALGKKIRSLRQARGWTQEQLAEYADLHVSYICLLYTSLALLDHPNAPALFSVQQKSFPKIRYRPSVSLQTK